jgi:peptidoglycan/LPS O-acetylase OafA/YrhL
VSHLGIAQPPLWSLVGAFPGVPIFFAISGFLISASFERAHSVVDYTRNRILRIYPGLWCVVLVTVVVVALFGFDLLHLRALGWLACQLVGLIYTPGFLKSFGFGSYNGALWTIPIELQFYLLLPLLYLGSAVTPRRRTNAIVAIWVVFVLVAFVYAMRSAPLAENAVESLPHKLFRYTFVPHIFLFLTGVVLQRTHAHRSRWIVGKGPLWLGVYLLIHFLLPGTALNYVVGSLVMAVMTVAMAYTLPGLSRTLLRGNDLSYGVYIYHGLVLNILIELGFGRRLFWLPVVLAVTTVAAFLSWRLVERPYLRRKRTSIHAVPAAPAT